MAHFRKGNDSWWELQKHCVSFTSEKYLECAYAFLINQKGHFDAKFDNLTIPRVTFCRSGISPTLIYNFFLSYSGCSQLWHNDGIMYYMRVVCMRGKFICKYGSCLFSFPRILISGYLRLFTILLDRQRMKKSYNIKNFGDCFQIDLLVFVDKLRRIFFSFWFCCCYCCYCCHYCCCCCYLLVLFFRFKWWSNQDDPTQIH